MCCFCLPPEQVLLDKHAFNYLQRSPRYREPHRFSQVWQRRASVPPGHGHEVPPMPGAPGRTPRCPRSPTRHPAIVGTDSEGSAGPARTNALQPREDSARPFWSRAASAGALRAAQLRRTTPAIHHTLTHPGAELSPSRGYPLQAKPWSAASVARPRGPPGAPAPRAPPPHLLAAEAPHRPIPPRSPRR